MPEARDTPPEAPSCVALIRSYPPLDFFTPLAPTWFFPHFPRVAAPHGAWGCFTFCVKCVGCPRCVAMVGMWDLTDDIWWLDIDYGEE